MPGLIGEWTPGGGAAAGFVVGAACPVDGSPVGFGAAVGGGAVGCGGAVGSTVGAAVGGGAVGFGGAVGAAVGGAAGAVVGAGGAVFSGFGAVVGAGGAAGAAWLAAVGATVGFASAPGGVGFGAELLPGNRPPASTKPTPAATRVIARSIRTTAAVRPAEGRSLAGSKPPGLYSARSRRSVC